MISLSLAVSLHHSLLNINIRASQLIPTKSFPILRRVNELFIFDELVLFYRI